MKIVAVLMVSFVAVLSAQERKDEEKTPHRDKKRLESVTWDLTNHKLVWVVQKGSERDGKFVASSSDRYEISPDEAVMAVSDEKRGFTKEEAASLHKLLDTLSLYCAESVVWWDRGEGIPLDGKPIPKKNHTPPSGKGQRVEEHKPVTPAPDPSLLIALLARQR